MRQMRRGLALPFPVPFRTGCVGSSVHLTAVTLTPSFPSAPLWSHEDGLRCLAPVFPCHSGGYLNIDRCWRCCSADSPSSCPLFLPFPAAASPKKWQGNYPWWEGRSGRDLSPLFTSPKSPNPGESLKVEAVLTLGPPFSWYGSFPSSSHFFPWQLSQLWLSQMYSLGDVCPGSSRFEFEQSSRIKFRPISSLKSVVSNVCQSASSNSDQSAGLNLDESQACCSSVKAVLLSHSSG